MKRRGRIALHIDYKFTAEEGRIIEALMARAGLSETGVMDLALWRIASWYDIPLLPEHFAIGAKSSRANSARAGRAARAAAAKPMHAD